VESLSGKRKCLKSVIFDALMQSKDDLRKALHELIDAIDDQDLLLQLMDDVVPYLLESKNRQLPPEEKKEDEPEGGADWDAYKIDPDNPGTKN
jgi:hypothetical protein